MDKQDKRYVAAYSLLLSIIAAICITVFLPQSDADNPNSQHTEHSNSVSNDLERVLYGAYDVIRVVDGDTIIVSVDGTAQRIRLIGVDTPESVHPDADKNTENGKIAAAYTAELLTGKQVYLEYDIDRTDDYGRTLAYVWLDGCMVEDLLLQNGMAETMKIAPNTKYSLHFSELEHEAKENEVGFWKKDN